MRVKEKSEKAGLKFSIRKLRSWHPIPSFHGKYKEKKWKWWQILFSWVPKSLWTVTAAMKLKTLAMTNLNSALKSRDITLQTKVCTVKAMVFPVVMYGCENWSKGWRTVAFDMWCWRRLLRVPWSARRSNQSSLKEIYPEYSLKGLLLKLKLQYFGHLIWRADSLEKTLMLGKIESRRSRGWQRIRWLDRVTDSMDMNLSKLWELVEDRGPWHAIVHEVERVGHSLMTEQQQQRIKDRLKSYI